MTAKTTKQRTPLIAADDRRRFHIDKRAERIVASSEGDDDDLLDSIQLADWLGMSLQWVETARCQGVGPPFIRVGARAIRYQRGAVRRWLDARARASYSAA